MRTKAIDYLAAAVLLVASRGGQGPLDSPQAITRYIKSKGFEIDQDLAAKIGRRLVELNFVTEVKDEYAGHFYRSVHASLIDDKINKIPGGSDGKHLRSAYKQGWPLLERAMDNDRFWVDAESYEGVQYSTDRSNSEVGEQTTAPASDRIVRIDDNQRSEIDQAAGELSKNLQQENGIDGDGDLRDRFLAQIAAGRALIQAGSVRAYLVYQTFVEMLGQLIKKFGGQAIGQVAKKLLDLLVEHIVGK